MTTLDIDWVRSQFPAFSAEATADWAHFENAGGSYACRPVIDRLTRFYTERKMQPYGPAAPSAAGGAEMDEARRRLARLLGVETEQVAFGPSTTQNTYVLAQAFRSFLKPGDAIVVTDQDHEANSGPWRRLAEAGIEVREWKMDPATGHLDPEALDALLDERVRLVCFPHCSNVVGEINPVAEIVARCHAAGAFTCVDGVSYAPHGLPDVGATGADAYLFSAYKTYGPHQGIMVMRPALGELLPNQAHFFNADTLYKRFTPAGPDHAQIAACAGIADYLEALADRHGVAPEGAHDVMRAAEVQLLKPLLEAVTNRNDVRLLGPADPESRAPTVTLSVTRPVEAAEALAERGIIAGASHFYAVRALQAMGVDPERGVLRLSFTHYTSAAEVDRLIGALDEVL